MSKSHLLVLALILLLLHFLRSKPTLEVIIMLIMWSLRMWKKAPKAEGIASVSIDVVAKGPNTEFIRWKVHGDWVQQVSY